MFFPQIAELEAENNSLRSRLLKELKNSVIALDDEDDGDDADDDDTEEDSFAMQNGKITLSLATFP